MSALEHTPAARGAGTARPRAAQGDAAQSCDRCGIRGPHDCAFRAAVVNVFCSRCAQWVGTDHVCPGAHCVVCETHGSTLASHSDRVARNLRAEESAS